MLKFLKDKYSNFGCEGCEFSQKFFQLEKFQKKMKNFSQKKVFIFSHPPHPLITFFKTKRGDADLQHFSIFFLEIIQSY